MGQWEQEDKGTEKQEKCIKYKNSLLVIILNTYNINVYIY